MKGNISFLIIVLMVCLANTVSAEGVDNKGYLIRLQGQFGILGAGGGISTAPLGGAITLSGEYLAALDGDRRTGALALRWRMRKEGAFLPYLGLGYSYARRTFKRAKPTHDTTQAFEFGVGFSHHPATWFDWGATFELGYVYRAEVLERHDSRSQGSDGSARIAFYGRINITRRLGLYGRAWARFGPYAEISVMFDLGGGVVFTL